MLEAAISRAETKDSLQALGLITRRLSPHGRDNQQLSTMPPPPLRVFFPIPITTKTIATRGHPSRSTGDLAPVLVTSSLSGSAGHYSSPARSRSVAAGFERTGGARQTAYGGSDRGGSGSLIALGSLGSQRNLNVGNLLKGAARPGGAAGGGDAADLPRHPLRGGEAAPGAQTLQVRAALK